MVRIRRVGQRDAGEPAIDALDFAPGHVDLGEPGREPVRLVAVGQLLDGAAGRVDAGLAGRDRRPRGLGGGLGRLLHLGGGRLVLERLGRGGFQLRDRRGPLVDVGAQPPTFGERRHRRGVRGTGGGSDHVGLFELLGERTYGLRRRPRCGKAFDASARSSVSSARSRVSAPCVRTASSTCATAAAHLATSSSAARNRLVAAAHSPVGRPVGVK